VNSKLRAVRHEGILLLTLEHPSGLPRLERSVLHEIARQIDSLAATRDLAGAIITGSTQAFCAGAELAEITSLLDSETLDFARAGQRVMDQIECSAKPVIAAIRGYCMGGGFDLALACRARICSSDVVFAHRGASLGLITGWGGTQRLPRLIGQSRALEIFVTGRTIAADEALSFGLVRDIVPADELLLRAVELSRRYAANPTCA
jgi:enoyl-CoA hydratase